MARAAGSAGRINRRYMMLALVFAVLSAILVYVAISRTGETAGESSSTTAGTVVAIVDIPARTQITKSMIELRDIPMSGRIDTGLSSIDDAVGKVAKYPIARDEQLTSTRLVSLDSSENLGSLSFAVPTGMRAISIEADQVLSAGGLVLPGDFVDILAVFDVKNAKGDEEEAYFVRTVLQNIEVLAVAQKVADTSVVSDGESASKAKDSEPDPKATTLTLLVTPEQSEFIFLAESNGTLRAVLRGYGDANMADVRPIVETELWPVGMAPPPVTQ